MKLHISGREYATFTVTAPTDAALSVSFDAGVTWHPMERPTATTARILIAGPLASDNPAGTVVVPRGGSAAVVRLTDSPEQVVRDAGTISCQ